ncbi:MAG: hypothetical protein ACOC58_04330, partial [Chloroflexota bacterium]
MTAVFEGVSAGDFRRHFEPTCRSLRADNRLGKLVFTATHQIKARRSVRRGLLQMVSSSVNRLSRINLS